MMDGPAWLRLLSAAALVVAAAAFFRGPLERQLGPLVGLAQKSLGTTAEGTVEALPPAPPTLILQLSSRPSGARVLIDGGDRGRTPAITNVSCRPETTVTLTLTHPSAPPWSRQLACQPGATLAIDANLTAPPPPPTPQPPQPASPSSPPEAPPEGAG